MILAFYSWGVGEDPRIFSLEIRGGVQGFFPLKSGGSKGFSLEIRGGVQGLFPWKSEGVLRFFYQRVMRRVIFDTHNYFNMKCGRLKKCLNALEIDKVCILGVFGSLLFIKVVLPS